MGRALVPGKPDASKLFRMVAEASISRRCRWMVSCYAGADPDRSRNGLKMERNQWDGHTVSTSTNGSRCRS